MILKNAFLGVIAVLSLVAGRVSMADETVNNNFHFRYDLSCHFENEHSCEVWASIFTNHHDFGNDGANIEALNRQINRMAVNCEDHGLIYANGAQVTWGREHVIVSAPGGVAPKLVFHRHTNSDLTALGGQVRLVLPNGRHLSGECMIHRDELH